MLYNLCGKVYIIDFVQLAEGQLVTRQDQYETTRDAWVDKRCMGGQGMHQMKRTEPNKNTDREDLAH